MASVLRIRILQGAVLSLGFSLSLGEASAQVALPDVLSRYRPVVNRFLKGQEAAAVQALGSWTEAEIRRDLRVLRVAAEKLGKCPRCPERPSFEGFPVRAAILLHAHREMLEQFERPESEQVAECGVGLQSHLMEQYIRVLLLLDPEDSVFARDVYIAMSRHAQWTHCVALAVEWAAMGLKVFPDDASLHLAHGIALETRAFFAAAPSPDTTGFSASSILRRQELLASYRRMWEDAQRAFQATVTADPRRPEARLRLGRVLWRLGRVAEAATVLEAVLAQDSAPEHAYLAHLFLGRVLEEKGSLDEAERHYLEALKREPLSLNTAVALSHVRFLRGDVAAARETMIAGMAAVASRTTFDPWVAYEITQTPDGLALLDDLRKRIWP